MHDIRQFGGTQDFEVDQIIVHNKFNNSFLTNDIALIKLYQIVVYNNFIQPICLWPQPKADISNVVNQMGTVAGWGMTHQGSLATHLNKATLKVVSLSDCLKSKRDFYGGILSDDNFCAGNQNETNVCTGDSGGGLVFEYDRTWYLRGIVSNGPAGFDSVIKCSPKDYVVFTDAAKYRDWIGKYL